jgi:hypothetical protein
MASLVAEEILRLIENLIAEIASENSTSENKYLLRLLHFISASIFAYDSNQVFQDRIAQFTAFVEGERTKSLPAEDMAKLEARLKEMIEEAKVAGNINPHADAPFNNETIGSGKLFLSMIEDLALEYVGGVPLYINREDYNEVINLFACVVEAARERIQEELSDAPNEKEHKVVVDHYNLGPSQFPDFMSSPEIDSSSSLTSSSSSTSSRFSPQPSSSSSSSSSASSLAELKTVHNIGLGTSKINKIRSIETSNGQGVFFTRKLLGAYPIEVELFGKIVVTSILTHWTDDMDDFRRRWAMQIMAMTPKINT